MSDLPKPPGLLPDGTWSARQYMADKRWTIQKAIQEIDYGLLDPEYETLTTEQYHALLDECREIRRAEVRRMEQSGELKPTTATIPAEYLGPCDPPLSNDEVPRAYLRALEEGTRVIEHGVSGLQGRQGTVYIDKGKSVCVRWDRLPGHIGQMSTTVTAGCRIYNPPRVSRMVCKTCGERPELSDAWREACVATATATANEDPIPCYFCGTTYSGGRGAKAYPIMDCLVPAHIERKPHEPTQNG